MKSLLVLSLIFVFNFAEAKSFVCNPYLADSQQQADETTNFSSYLAKLYEEKVLNFEDFEKIQNVLKTQNKIINPLNDSADIKSEASTHKHYIDAYIESGLLDLSKLTT